MHSFKIKWLKSDLRSFGNLPQFSSLVNDAGVEEASHNHISNLKYYPVVYDKEHSHLQIGLKHLKS